MKKQVEVYLCYICDQCQSFVIVEEAKSCPTCMTLYHKDCLLLHNHRKHS